MEPRRLITLAIVSALLLGAGPAPTSLESSIRQIQTTATVPDGFEVVYEAMHPLHGGTVIEIKGDGSAKRTSRHRGSPEVQTRHTRLSEPQILELVGLLLKLEAWEQRVPERQPVPGEGKATLSITLGPQKGGFWEWHNDLSKNDRLVQVARMAKELVPE
jgi:hypothetical protein